MKNQILTDNNKIILQTTDYKKVSVLKNKLCKCVLLIYKRMYDLRAFMLGQLDIILLHL